MSTPAVTINGVSVYSLSNGKTLPQWMPEKKRKLATKDPEYRRRIDLIQDFGFPSACQSVQMSSDGRYVIATGTYPPRVRVFDTTELSMKFERYMDATPVTCCSLSDDYTKLAFLQDDRNVEVHAGYGRHYRTRIPRFGRDMAFHAPTAELIVAAGDSEVYRLSLEEGRFLASMKVSAPGVNKVAVSRLTALIGLACDGGRAEIIDPREPGKCAAALEVEAGDGSAGGTCDVTALAFDEAGPGMVLGTSDGRALVYDLRRSVPLVTKQHQYELPVTRVGYHRSSKGLVYSMDAKIVKLWGKQDGKVFTNIETPNNNNDMCIVSDKPGVGGTDSGLVLVGSDVDRILAYYVPQLGPAPRWCAFLDNLTEELDDMPSGVSGSTAHVTAPQVYDDYRFVTRDELAVMGLSHLIGTPLLKAYMHGFFMDARLYMRVKSVVDPDAQAAYRKAKVRERMEAERKSRVDMEDDSGLPAVNKELAARLRAAQASGAKASFTRDDSDYEEEEDDEDAEADGSEEEDEEEEATGPAKKSSKGPAPSSLLSDPRFAKLFTDTAFAIDTDTPEFAALHPAARASASGGSSASGPAARASNGRSFQGRSGGGSGGGRSFGGGGRGRGGGGRGGGGRGGGRPRA